MDFEVDFKVDLEFGFSSHPMQVNPRRFWILDSSLWISGFQVLDSSFCLLELGFLIPVVGEIPDSKDQDSFSTSEFVPDSGFLKQNFPSLHGVIRVTGIMLPK